jgi:phosphate starvation-inducible PhoH-like protein
MADSLIDLFSQFTEMARRGVRPSGAEIRYALDMIAAGLKPDFLSLMDSVICVSSRGKQIRPFTLGQKEYVDAVRDNDVVFAIGPAGTGKTYLAVAVAVAALKSARINRIVLVRPVVEAGEHLGYLPGDLLEKVQPYIRPLYDAFYDLLPPDRFNRYIEKGIIEIAPLAYMRGRTLNNSFIILDEAQNTTKEQMKMFLTRLGLGSKAVLTGDVTQIDLPGNKESGLRVVGDILRGVAGIAFCSLSSRDVVRHDIVQKIVKAYESYEKRKEYGHNGEDSQKLVS